MKKVALFKSESEDYRKAFSESGFFPLFVEPLQFQNVNGPQLAARLLRPEYDALVITSPRAVAALAACWDSTKCLLWSTKRIYTVGETTSRKIKVCLGLESLGETSGNADNLAKIIIRENPKATKFLFPCGNLRSELLPNVLGEAEISVDALTVYETEENENLRNGLMDLSSEHDLCCLVFFSPSGCEYIYRKLQTFSNKLSQLPHFAIGNSTAHKIENLGLEIAGVATKPQAESLLESIQTYFITVHSSS